MILHCYEGGDHNRALLSSAIAVLLTAAVATGVDEIAVGVTLAFVRANILLHLALIVSAVIFLLVCCGAFLGWESSKPRIRPLGGVHRRY